MKGFVFGFHIAAAINNNFNNAFSSASSQILSLNQKIRENKKIVKLSAAAAKNGTITMKSYNNALSQTYKYYSKASENAQKYLKIQGQLNQRRTSMSKNEANMMSLGGIAYSLTKPLRQAIEFESAMSDVRKVVDFESPQQFQQMNQDILELSKRIPMTADGLASIVAAGGQSGIARKDLLSFAESAAKMGTAFDITADQAGEMMAKWRTAFKMNQNQVVELADKINYLSNKTAASAPLISDVVTRIGPLGSVGGVASGEIAALGASLVGAGVQSEVAATGIKNFILTMVAGKGATKDQSAAFSRLGFDSEIMAQRMQTDAKVAILDVLKAIQSLNKEEQASTLQQLFGKESIGAIAPLLSNIKALENNFGLVANKTQYAGSMQEEFNTKAQTTANQLSLLKNEFNAVMTSVGNGMIPAFNYALAAISPLGKALGNFFTQNNELTGSVLVSGAAITAFGALSNFIAWTYNGIHLAINGATQAFTSVRQFMIDHSIASKISTAATKAWTAAQWAWNTAIKAGSLGAHTAKIIIHKGVTMAASMATRTWAVAQWAWNAAMSANPIGLVIAGVAGLIAAGYALYNNWDTVKQWFITMWDAPGDVLQQFIDGIKNKFNDAFAWLKDKWESIQNFLSTPIFGKVNILAQNTVGNTPNIAQNATGGIYSKGAFLTTFAEESGESAIPHTPNAKNIGLLAKTNQIMGNPLGVGNGVNVYPQINVQSAERAMAPMVNNVFKPLIQSPAVNIQQSQALSPIATLLEKLKPREQGRDAVSNGEINATFAPNITIQGNADEKKLRQVLDDEMAKFRRMLEELKSQQRRVSYA